MRDRVLEEALKRLAAEAATRLAALVQTGDEIPFDVAENEGESAHFYRYVPLTGAYVVEHFDEIASLPSFGPAKGAVAAAGVAAAFLERRRLPISPDPGERAEEMLTSFLSELWEGQTGFALDLARLGNALESLDVETRDIRESDLLLVPLQGFEMTLEDVEFSNGVRILRADAVEAPIEAITSDGTGRDAWQPACLATVPMTSASDAPRDALGRFHALMTALRLAKEGCAGLAPHAFAPVGEGEWRRIETGAVPARRGTWLMVEADTDRVERILTRLGNGAVRVPGAEFALTRFEAGLERDRPLDGLSDHLLAIRALMVGESITGSTLAARGAALVEGVTGDGTARQRLESAFELETRSMRGERITTVEGESASYLAAWLEDSVRSVLRAAVIGEIGDDLNAVAEEILISSGLESGEGSIGQLGSEVEWEGITPPAEEEGQGAEIHVLRPRNGFSGGVSQVGDPIGFGESEPIEAEESPDGRDETIEMPEIERALGIVREESAEDGSLVEPAPDPGEIIVSAAEGTIGAPAATSPPGDWLEDARRGITMEWPAPGEFGRSGRDARQSGEKPTSYDTGIFPRPESADWDVSELDYPRRRGA